MTRKLVCGVGIYEKGKYLATTNCKMTKEYDTWKHMLHRCYSEKYHIDYPTYIECTVCDEWLIFQNFARWFNTAHPSDGGKYELDKDLKNPGNKIYSPENCLFVHHNVNNFILGNNKIRGECLIGVYWHKRKEKYISRCKNPITREMEYLGSFSDELDAHLMWRERKSELAYKLAMMQSDINVGSAILRWKDMLDMNLIHTYRNKNAPSIGA